jgi:S1-C subfamily serine protease
MDSLRRGLVALILVSTAATKAVAQLPEWEKAAQADCLQNDDSDRAIRGCTALLRGLGALDPLRAAPLAKRGAAYGKKGLHEQAIADLTQAIQINPGKAIYYAVRGESFSHLRNHSRAIADFNQSVQLDPTSPSTFFYRGLEYWSLGQRDRAFQDLDESIRIQSTVLTHYTRGDFYAEIGDTKRARADYEKALALSTNSKMQTHLRQKLASLQERKSPVQGSSGTGIVVSADGRILTNSHVVHGCTEFHVNKVGAVPVSARLLAVDQSVDLAILQASVLTDVLPSFRTAARLGENVFVFGFPLSGLLAASGNFTAGNITATAGPLDDAKLLQLSAPVQPGNSGGPLLDAHGNVAKLDALMVANVTKDLPQNVIFAIKASVAAHFLKANGVTTQFTSSVSQSLAPDEIAERATALAVHVTCK